MTETKTKIIDPDAKAPISVAKHPVQEAPKEAKLKDSEGKPISAVLKIDERPNIDVKLVDMVKGSTNRPEPVFYVKLDDEGRPTGPVLESPPLDGTPYAPVAADFDRDEEHISRTPSGAPITAQMNPTHSFKDSGMESRNPTPPRPDMKKIADKALRDAEKAAA